MKAWLLENPYDDEGRQAVVFADTRNEAKAQADDFNIDCEWIYLRATRYKNYDDKENLTMKELYFLLWKEGWWFEYGSDRIPLCDDEDITDTTFEDWWNRTYGNAEVIK